jgi:hypothetical protein
MMLTPSRRLAVGPPPTSRRLGRSIEKPQRPHNRHNPTPPAPCASLT